MLEWLGQAISYSVWRVILPLALVVGLTMLGLRLVDWAAATVDTRFIAPVDDDDRRARLQTLRRVAKSTVKVALLAIALLIGLSTVGINIGPALAAAGIVGLAISLGAQTLIKDMIGGLTILLEDEYRVGDSVKIGSVSGDVARITLRRTDVRDAEGRLFVVPNGEVRIVANETREWAQALVDIHFGFEVAVERAVAVLEKVLAHLAEDPLLEPLLLATPEIFGWNSFTDWSVTVRLRARVHAGNQGEVARVMRQRALAALQAAGIPVESRNRMAAPPGSGGPA